MRTSASVAIGAASPFARSVNPRRTGAQQNTSVTARPSASGGALANAL